MDCDRLFADMQKILTMAIEKVHTKIDEIKKELSQKIYEVFQKMNDRLFKAEETIKSSTEEIRLLREKI